MGVGSLSYIDLANTFGVKMCQGNWYGEIGTPEPDHVRGWAQANTLHWYPHRRVTRAGLRRFLMLVAQTRIRKFSELSVAEQLHATNSRAVQYAAEVHVRIPRRYSDADRARARYLISKGNIVTPSARRWAHRQEDTTDG